MSAESPFQAEGWVEYAIGVSIIFLRFYARWKTVGVKNWTGDDIFSLVALVLWTMDITVVTMVGKYGTNIGVTEEALATMSAEEISQREIGSKWLFTGWNTYVALIWALKGCMLCYFNRVTLGLKQQKIVKWTGVACVATYFIMLIIIFTQCTPVSDNWKMSPIPTYNCSVKTANYVAVAVLNVTTDMIIVAIPIPLLFAVKLTMGRKLAIGVLLCSGVFVMIATLLRCILSLQNVEAINTCTIWAIRETFIAIIAVNAACIKPLFSSKRWLKSSSKEGTDSNTPHGKSGRSYSLWEMAKGSKVRSALPFHTSKAGTQILSSSEENIVGSTALAKNAQSEVKSGSASIDTYTQDSPSHGRSQSATGIVVTTTYQVEKDGNNAAASESESKW